MMALNPESRAQGRPAQAWVLYTLSILVLATLSSSDNCTNCPGPCPSQSGRAVLDAVVREDQNGHFYFEGFSFSEGGVVRLPNEQGTKSDFIISFMIGSEGEVIGLFLGQLDMMPAFDLVATGGTVEEGQQAFDGMSCLPEDLDFQMLAGPVEPHQVWAIKAHDGRFGKILVVDTFFCSQSHDSSGVTITQTYGEITFDWEYQPDGSMCFQ